MAAAADEADGGGALSLLALFALRPVIIIMEVGKTHSVLVSLSVLGAGLLLTRDCSDRALSTSG